MNALSKLTVNAQKALIGSKNIAKMSGSEIIIPQHLFIAITNNKDSLASRLLANMGINLDATKENIKIPENKTSRTRRSIRLSSNLKTIIRDSYAISYELGHVYVGTEHLLLALLKARNLAFVKDLEDGGLDYDDVKGKLLSFANYPPGIFTKSDSKEDVSDSALGSFGKDLTSLAEQSSLLPIIGRDEEIDRMINILARRTKNNPILIGDAGVGKTAVVEGLAQRIVERKVPESIQKLRIISIDISSIIAGSKVRGELEEKVLDVINEVVRDKNTILFIDEIHVIAGASPTGSGADIANVLKPVLTDPYLKVIGATTYAEYKKTFDEDEALRRRFQPVMVEEVNIEDGIKILEGLKDQFEDYHNVKIYDDAIKDAVGLSSRYIAERYLPDKAIDVIDEAAATVKISREKKYPALNKLDQEIDDISLSKLEALKSDNFRLAAEFKKEEDRLKKKRVEFSKQKGKILKSKGYTVRSEDVRDVISRWTGIPVNTLTQSDKKILKNLSKILSKNIIGQERSVEKVAAALKRARVGIGEKDRPLSSFLFLGPTGVGKTETAKVIAKELFGSESALIQIDMSELMEKHAVSKLIGSPPGYIGYQEGGQLTDKVRRRPYSVVLFDEIEKAHIDVLNILLQVLEEGRLTDGKGRQVSFQNTIIIMTSNIGAEDIGKHEVLGFDLEFDQKANDSKEDEDLDTAYQEMRNELIERLKAYLRPEFLNRLDEVIIFRGLSIKDASDIVKIQIDKLNERLAEKGIKLLATKKEYEFIAEQGFSDEYGARPLKRAIQELVESPLSDLILEKGENLGEIKLQLKKDRLTLN
ncbi:ATP-dependent Clp protease ATP-binding subunit [Candidatus Dojkabacteria bacterium]|uniref:ATP-dependent Clp protease ATP-binding subunit n=2 Tax=Candidatus Dojkabacteria bacterium TaxID=2099670 RepID=A0A955L4Q5_9BACT|nr:ATP-dependent Clp protease ATP-binding subunit [Candidatus Dojkabacteria bacterium]